METQLLFIACHLKGGLGNQLFQIFNALRNAIKYNGKIVFTNATLLGNRSTYWSNLLDALQKYTMSIHYSDFKSVIREKGFEYKSLDADVLSIMTNDNSQNQKILFDGYFQSPKYFEDVYPTIYHTLRIAEKQEIVRKKLVSMNVDFNNAVTVSMHFRLGDYKNLPNHHPVLKKEYYNDALKHISLHSPNKITHVLYFYQNDNEDAKEIQKNISALKEQLPDIQFISIYSLSGTNTLVDWEEMLAMSCCTHHIIANSTFSWWGAYLSNFNKKFNNNFNNNSNNNFNNNFNKIICYPSTWFGPALKCHDTRDLFPVEWTRIC